jgi:hypothetical protein
MSTPLQRASSRRNSAASTGPRTPRGRAAVAANPLTHGFYSRVVLDDFEDPADYHATLADFLADLRPAGAVEVELVHRYVKDLWKLRRLERLERAFIVDTIEHAERCLDSPLAEQRAFFAYHTSIDSQFRQYKSQTPFERLALLQHRLRRAVDSTLRLLTTLQSERLAAPASAPFAEISSLPPDTLDYRLDPPPDAADPASPPSLDRADSPIVPSDALSPDAANPASPAVPSDPLSPDTPPAFGQATDRPPQPGSPGPSASSADPDASSAPASNAAAGATRPASPDPSPQLPPTPGSPGNTPASPSIHKPNPTIGFVPPKNKSTLSPHPAKRTPRRAA